MSESLPTTGVPSIEELEKSPGFPSKKRLMKGSVAVIECIQEIPCDVCASACPFGAISLASISSLPELDEEKCTGCGACVPFCPGLAIFLVDSTFSRDEASISFPYEFLPVPKVGEVVDATDRLGLPIVKGRIAKVLERKSFDRTLVVTIAVPKRFAQLVRGIVLPKGSGKV